MTTEMQMALLDQIWFNMQTMEPKERKKFIKKVNSLSNTNCGFIHFAAKDFLQKCIDYSECYYKP